MVQHTRGFGQKGQPIKLLTNHIEARVVAESDDVYLVQYNVTISYQDGTDVNAICIKRKVMDRVCDINFPAKHIAYNGKKRMFTVGSLQTNREVFFVELESSNYVPKGSSKRFRLGPQRSNIYKVMIKLASRIPVHAIENAQSKHFQKAIGVLDFILRQHSARQGCLLFCQSVFHNQQHNFSELGGGVLGCRGSRSSFKATQAGLSLNIDVSTTMIVKPGPVIEFLLENQNVEHLDSIDWGKAKRTLKNLRIRIKTSNVEHIVIGLSERICKEERFAFKPRKEYGSLQLPTEITVYNYFVDKRKWCLGYSSDLPCIDVGKPNHPNYIPMELCELVSLQRYTKALTVPQRASLVEKSRQKPQERMRNLNKALRTNNHNADPLLRLCGVTIGDRFTSVSGRVLSAPKLRVGNEEDLLPQNGRWNFNNKKLLQPIKIEQWAVVNYSGDVDNDILIRDLIRCAGMKGMTLLPPKCVFQEEPQYRHDSALNRVEEMFEKMTETLDAMPEFLLCILPEKKNSALYGPWKKMCLSLYGIVTQCLAPTKINDQYLTNVLLKINAKMGGLNSSLAFEADRRLFPVVSGVPTLIVGMHVTHGSPGCAAVPSIAAIVSSREWPSISKYQAVVRTQSPNTEMINSLYQKVVDEDLGIFMGVLLDFYRSSHDTEPQQIIIFRAGVSESQFNQVLNTEFDQIIQACKHLDEEWSPKFTLLVAQKNHHTKIFHVDSPDNVPPGTVVDTGICLPRKNDFFLCAHAGMTGTSRLTQYHVLRDDIDFSADDLQELVNSLSYVNQRSTTANSIVAPIWYARLAARQMSQFINFDELCDTASSQLGVESCCSPSSGVILHLPKLDKNVSRSMFFC